jgi:hypothetical protein
MSFYFSSCPRVFSFLFLFLYGFEGVFDCGECRNKKEEVVLCQKCV